MSVDEIIVINTRFCNLENKIKEIEGQIEILAQSHIKLERVVTMLVSAISGKKIKHYMDGDNDE